MIASALLAAVLAFAQAEGAPAPPRDAPDAGTPVSDGGTDADGGADGGTARKSPEATPSELAKKAIDLAHIDLGAARLYVVGLFHLSRKPISAWDRAHSVTLFNSAENAMTDSDRSLSELSGMARGKWEKAAAPLTHARSTVAQALKDLRALSVPTTASAAVDRQQVARKVHQELDSVRKDLDAAAKVMEVDTRIKEP
jgi:hypothetical protein